MNKTIEFAENIFDKESLQTNLSFMALYIGMFEFFKKTNIERVESLFCTEMVLREDGEPKWVHNEKYKKEVEQFIEDGKRVKNPVRSTMLWYKKQGALSDEDYALFRDLRDLRNAYAHQMAQRIWEGLPEKDAQSLMSLFNLYDKLDKWWINEIEIPIAGEHESDDYDRDGVQSVALLTFKIMVNSLFGGKSEEYMALLQKVKDGNWEDISF